MRKSLKALLVATALTAGIAAAPTLYAHDSESAQGSMMGQGGMMGQGMMGQGMMGQMSQMMESCNEMMQSMMGQHDSGKPNEQWQKEAPATPEESG